jgi:hypothetical protein
MIPAEDQHTPAQTQKEDMTPMVEVMEPSELQLHQLQLHPEVEEEEVEVEAQVVEVEVEEAVDQAIQDPQCFLLDIIEQELQEELLALGEEEVGEVVEEGVEEVEDLHQEGLQGEDLEAAALHQVEDTQMLTSGPTTC